MREIKYKATILEKVYQLANGAAMLPKEEIKERIKRLKKLKKRDKRPTCYKNNKLPHTKFDKIYIENRIIIPNQ